MSQIKAPIALCKLGISGLLGGRWERRACPSTLPQMQSCTTPPRGVCAHCLESDNLEHFVASGRGEVYTFTVTEQNQAKGFAEACPYVMAYVTLEEGPRILTVITDCSPDDVTVGAQVRVAFVDQERDDDERFAVPVFLLD